MAYSSPSCMHACVVHMADLLRTLSILLLASMLVPAGSAEEPQPPSVYRFDLIHVDANAGLTREELIRRALDRSHLREAMLSAATSASSTLHATAHYSQHEYLMELKIGTPPTPFHAAVDTGSDLVWTKHLKLCDPSSSSTLTRLPCSSSCTDPDTGAGGTCNAMCHTCYDELCMFKKTYGRKKITAKGFVVNETLTMSPQTGAGAGAGKEVKMIISLGCAIVCGDDNYCHPLLPKSADGLIGLSRGPNSLVSQLNLKSFSYCLNNPFTPKQKSPLWFSLSDDLSLPAGAGVQSTPLVQIQNPQFELDKYRYYVQVDGISIRSSGQERVKKLPKDAFKMQSNKGNNGVLFVDSGCQYSFLEKTAFEALKELLEEVLGASSTKKHEKTCFTAAAIEKKFQNKEKPEMVLEFTGAKMQLPWDNYMFLYDDSDFCLAIKESTVGRSILGNFLQQNIHMLYDLTKGSEKLSFVPKNCAG